MEKMKEFVISRNNFKTGFEAEVSVKTKDDSDLESTLKGIELLIESIDLKHACNEDNALYEESMKRILFMIADNLGCEGGYDYLDIKYDEDTDQPIITNKERVQFLKTFLSFEEQMINIEETNDQAGSYGFDLETCLQNVDKLKNDIRLKTFKKLCNSQDVSMGHVAIKKFYDENIVPKANEILLIISPELSGSTVFTNKLIEYAMGMINLEEMIDSMKRTLGLLHDLSIVLELTTLRETVAIQEQHQKK